MRHNQNKLILMKENSENVQKETQKGLIDPHFVFLFFSFLMKNKKIDFELKLNQVAK